MVIRPELTAQKNFINGCYCSLLYGDAAALDRFLFFFFLVRVVVRIYSNFIIGIKDYYFLKQPQRLSPEP